MPGVVSATVFWSIWLGNEVMYLKLVVHEATREIDDQVEMVKTFDKMETVRKMKQIVPEYKSNNSVYEVLDNVGM